MSTHYLIINGDSTRKESDNAIVTYRGHTIESESVFKENGEWIDDIYIDGKYIRSTYARGCAYGVACKIIDQMEAK